MQPLLSLLIASAVSGAKEPFRHRVRRAVELCTWSDVRSGAHPAPCNVACDMNVAQTQTLLSSLSISS